MWVIPRSPLLDNLFCLSTWRSPWGPISLDHMAASSRIDRGCHKLTKISFWRFFRVTFSLNDPCAYSLFLYKKFVIDRDLLPTINIGVQGACSCFSKAKGKGVNFNKCFKLQYQSVTCKLFFHEQISIFHR